MADGALVRQSRSSLNTLCSGSVPKQKAHDVHCMQVGCWVGQVADWLGWDHKRLNSTTWCWICLHWEVLSWTEQAGNCISSSLLQDHCINEVACCWMWPTFLENGQRDACWTAYGWISSPWVIMVLNTCSWRCGTEKKARYFQQGIWMQLWDFPCLHAKSWAVCCEQFQSSKSFSWPM